jgi:hypothetical protein
VSPLVAKIKSATLWLNLCPQAPQVKSIRLSDTEDNFVFTGRALGRQNDVCLHPQGQGDDCDKYFFDRHSVEVPFFVL